MKNKNLIIIYKILASPFTFNNFLFQWYFKEYFISDWIKLSPKVSINMHLFQMNWSSIDQASRAVWYWSTFVLMILSIPALAFMVLPFFTGLPFVIRILMIAFLSLTLLSYVIISTVRKKIECVWFLVVVVLNLISFVLSSYSLPFYFAFCILSLVDASVSTLLTVLVFIVQRLCCDSCCENAPENGSSVEVGSNYNSSPTYHKDDDVASVYTTSTVVFP